MPTATDDYDTPPVKQLSGTTECADFVICPAEKHQSNRRTEIKLVKAKAKKASNSPTTTRE